MIIMPPLHFLSFISGHGAKMTQRVNETVINSIHITISVKLTFIVVRTVFPEILTWNTWAIDYVDGTVYCLNMLQITCFDRTLKK